MTRGVRHLIAGGFLGLAIFTLHGCGPGMRDMLMIRGSDTMVNLVAWWAEDFMYAYPEHSVAVRGGGSGTGIAALFNRATDICASSRSIREEELQRAREMNIDIQEHVMALDGIAIAVHPDNPVDELTMSDLRQIWTGAYTNWADLGGPNLPMTVLSRDSNSGTYVHFQQYVLGENDFARTVRFMGASSSLVMELASNVGSIGYVGMGYVEDEEAVKVLAIKEDEDAEAVRPSIESVQSGAYSIARPLYFYTEGAPGEVAQLFIDFCRSEQGRDVVLETGFVPVAE